MAPETAVLFAGQGAYRPGLFAAAPERDVRETLAAIDAVAAEHGHSGVSGNLLREDAPSGADLALSDPFGLQLAIFAAGVLGFRESGRDHVDQVLVGHSMGEIVALTMAEAFTLADGARLVCRRSEALAECCSERGGMVALDLEAERARHLVGSVGDLHLVVAVLNAPRQTVVSGPDSALDTVSRLAQVLGVRATRLPAPFPFHNPALGIAAERFSSAIESIRQRPLRALVYSPVAGGYVGDGVDLKALLVRQLTTPVHFLTAIRNLHASGVNRFVEASPAGLLSLVRKTIPDAGARDEVAAVEPPGKGNGAPAVAPDLTSVVERLRDLYASTLGYPPHAVTAEADLEADLGIDSLKRAEMLARVAAQFELSPTANNEQYMNHQTLAELAQMIVAARAGTG